MYVCMEEMECVCILCVSECLIYVYMLAIYSKFVYCTKKNANVMLVKRWLIELLLLFVCSFVLFVRLLFSWFNDVSCVPELCV